MRLWLRRERRRLTDCGALLLLWPDVLKGALRTNKTLSTAFFKEIQGLEAAVRMCARVPQPFGLQRRDLSKFQVERGDSRTEQRSISEQCPIEESRPIAERGRDEDSREFTPAEQSRAGPANC